MSEQDRIDEIIRGLSADYNRPPETPRDEMWNAITAAQKSAGPRLHVEGGASAARLGGYTGPSRFGSRYTWIGMAAAAVLLVATGIGIGRLTGKPEVATVRSSGAKVIAENPPHVPAPTNDEIGRAPEQTSPAPSTAGGARQVSTPRPSTRSHEEIVKNPQIVGGHTLRPLPGTTQVAFNEPTANGDVYQVATAQHLASAEALLTSFAMGSRDAKMDAQFAQWAKGLLSNTRLLLDSPAGDDPRRAKLLQDLELVLAQIVQLSPNAAATDRELIQGTIQQGQVITRLRTAIPAGQPSPER